MKGTSGVFVCYDDIEGKKAQSAVDKFYVIYLHIIVCGHGYIWINLLYLQKRMTAMLSILLQTAIAAIFSLPFDDWRNFVNPRSEYNRKDI